MGHMSVGQMGHYFALFWMGHVGHGLVHVDP